MSDVPPTVPHDHAGKVPGIVWLVIGLVTLGFALSLASNLGSSLAVVTSVVASWLLLLAGAAAVRWWLDPARSSVALAVALVSLVASGALGYGALSLPALKAVLALWWVTVGVLEVVGRTPRSRSLAVWPALFMLFAGVVTFTFPSVLVVEFTVVAAALTFVLGLLALVKGGVLLWRDRRPATAEPSMWRRRAAVAVPALLLVVPVLAYGSLIASQRSADAHQVAIATFYEAPTLTAPGEPGDIVRSQPMEVDGLDGRAWRVMFRSEDQNGAPTVSTGMVFAPADDGADRPVVAWAHGTVGLGPTCAPSRDRDPLHHTPFVNAMLDEGWVVAAPDYADAAGTGPGEHYLVLGDQGRDVVNSVRAARQLDEAGAGSRYATYGESQGGAVALAAGAIGPEYAPELDLVGEGGVASASDVGALMGVKWDRPLATWLLGPHLVRAWTRAYPELDAASILSDAGDQHHAEVADDSCVFDILGALVNPRMGAMFDGDPTGDPDWRKAFIANKAPVPPADVPAFVAHGLADPLIEPGLSAGLVERYCEAGAAVTAHWMEGVEHIGSSGDAAPVYIDWLRDLLDGGTALSDCGKELPVEPVEELR